MDWDVVSIEQAGMHYLDSFIAYRKTERRAEGDVIAISTRMATVRLRHHVDKHYLYTCNYPVSLLFHPHPDRHLQTGIKGQANV